MRGDGDCGEIGGMNIGRGNESTQRKPAILRCKTPSKIFKNS
jgi:hypothetical protein